MSNYRVGRIVALLVRIGGWMVVAFCLFLATTVLIGQAGFFAQAAMTKLPLVAVGGLCLVLFGSLAAAVFDIADRKP